MMDKINGHIFWLNKVSRIKSELISKKNLIASLSIITNFLNIKTKSHGIKVKNFYDRNIPKAEYNHTCLAVIRLDSAFKKDGNYYPQVFLKECNTSSTK